MKSPNQWYKKIHPEGLGIEEKEQFLQIVKEIQTDALRWSVDMIECFEIQFDKAIAVINEKI